MLLWLSPTSSVYLSLAGWLPDSEPLEFKHIKCPFELEHIFGCLNSGAVIGYKNRRSMGAYFIFPQDLEVWFYLVKCKHNFLPNKVLTLKWWLAA